MAGWEREYGIKAQEIANAALREATGLRRDAALTSTTKRYGDTLKHVLPIMPSECAEMPALFRYGRKCVCRVRGPKQHQSQVDIAAVVIRAKSVICRLTAVQMDDYDELKRFLLAQFNLTPREYKVRFVSASKTADGTYFLKARLHNQWLYYIRSRQAEGNYERLVNILVSDRLKECLSASALNYVMNLEGDAFFERNRVAMLADTYANNYQDGKYKSNQITQVDVAPKDNKGKKGI